MNEEILSVILSFLLLFRLFLFFLESPVWGMNEGMSE